MEKIRSRLLIVDDEESITLMLEKNFIFLGYEVKTASNGKEAMKKISLEKFDVVITDIIMPEMNGVDLLREIKKRFSYDSCDCDDRICHHGQSSRCVQAWCRYLHF